MFVTIDGPNGVGKSTLVKGLGEKLLVQGGRVFITGEPTATPLGELLRRSEEEHRGEPLACLAAADRYSHIKNEIRPALARGIDVISDRYVESSLVLQRLDGCSADFILALHCNILIPDLSVIITGDPEMIEQRLERRSKPRSKFERVYTRAQEVELYLEAGQILAVRGFTVLRLVSTDEPVDQNIQKIEEEMERIRAKAKTGGR